MMSGFSIALILFVVFVMPVWIMAHYSSKKQKLKQVSEEDIDVLEDLLATLDRLEGRLNTLEKLVFPTDISSSKGKADTDSDQSDRGAA